MKSERITAETREAGLQAILPFADTTRERAYEAVRAAHRADGHGGRTAEEVWKLIGGTLNNTRSRLTELFKAGRLIVTGKRLSASSGVKIAVYDLP